MARRDFLDRIEALLRRNLSPAVASTYNVPQIAEHCVETAEARGLITERAIAAFTLHMVRINPEFHAHPRMREILDNTRVDENLRMEQLLSDPSETDWEEAATMCNPDVYWQPMILLNPQGS